MKYKFKASSGFFLVNKLVFKNQLISLPFKWGNSGGWNCELRDAKWGGKNRGGVARGVPLSSSGRKLPLLKIKWFIIEFVYSRLHEIYKSRVELIDLADR